MRFGEKVRDLRKKHSLTQDELAKCLGVSKRTIISWERDGRYPRNVEILEKMADIFHVPLTYIQPDQSLMFFKSSANRTSFLFQLTVLITGDPNQLLPVYRLHRSYLLNPHQYQPVPTLLG